MKTQFEKIYVLSLITNKERQEFIKYQMNELGLDFEFIYGIDFYNFEDFDPPNVYQYCNDPYSNYYINKDIQVRCYGTALTHYCAVMHAYHLGYNNVLILEDDVIFIKNKELIEDTLNKIPYDADFVPFDIRHIPHTEQLYQEYIKEHLNETYILDEMNYNFWGADMYGIMNRNTMKLYLDNQHKNFVQSDWVENIWHNSNVQRYIPTVCLHISQYFYKEYFSRNNPEYSLFPYDNLFYRIYNYPQNVFFTPENFHLSSIDININE